MRSLIILSFFVTSCCQAQNNVIFKDATKANREKLQRHLSDNTIHKNLSLPLSESTEENWQDAFYAVALLQYNNPRIDRKVNDAVIDLPGRSVQFQRSVLELLYDRYPGIYVKEVKHLMRSTKDAKLFAMSGEYILKSITSLVERDQMLQLIRKKESEGLAGPHLKQFAYSVANWRKSATVPAAHTLLTKEYLKGNVLLISFQRKNRNYPGLALVRDSSGHFLKNDDGSFFSVPQLARSIYNLPGYISNGNTPEGLFRMDGFDVSRLSMIGPTTNVQLTMPMEYHAHHFYRDSTLKDSIGNLALYKKLLPKNFMDYFPMQQSFYAGQAGRTEIIAHGTTVDPDYYTSQPYHPFTPTMGCLCTTEIWSTKDGSRLKSDQQILIEAISAAGGPHGYAIVLNIDDTNAPVTIEELLPHLKLAGQN